MLTAALLVWICGGFAGAAPVTHLHGYSSALPLTDVLGSGFDDAGAWTHLLPALADADADERAGLRLHVRRGQPAAAGSISVMLYSDFSLSLQVSQETRQFFGHALTPEFDALGSWDLHFSTASAMRDGVELTVPLHQSTHGEWGVLLNGWNVRSMDQRFVTGVGWIDEEHSQMQFDYSHVSSDMQAFRRASFSGRGASLGIFTQGEAGPVRWQVKLSNLWSRERLDHVFFSEMRYTSHPVQTDDEGELTRRPPGEGSWRYGEQTFSRPLHITGELRLSLAEEGLQPRVRYDERGLSFGVLREFSWGTLHAGYHMDDGLFCAAWEGDAVAVEVGTRWGYRGQPQSVDLRFGFAWMF